MTIWDTEHDHHVATVLRGEWGDDYPVIVIEEGLPLSCTGELKLKAKMHMTAHGRISEEEALETARLFTAAYETAAERDRLVIAKTELLKACKGLLHHFCGGSEKKYTDAIIMKAAQAAVAKAEK